MKSSALRKTTLLVAGSLLIATGSVGPGLAAIKKIAYPEVKVEAAKPYQPDAAFQTFWKAFSDAVANKDTAALTALIGPMFVWTSQRSLVDEFDPGRDAAHNFKVAFGFREIGKDQDGGVENGPYWNELEQFVRDPTFYGVSDTTSMTCGPLLAETTGNALDQAQKKLRIGDDLGDWYFTTGASVAKAPGDTGAPVGKLGEVAFPVLSMHPPEKDGAPAPVPTHYEVLMPSGRTGWIAASAARPLYGDRLCYAKTADGRWTIVNFDQDQPDQ